MSRGGILQILRILPICLLYFCHFSCWAIPDPAQQVKTITPEDFILKRKQLIQGILKLSPESSKRFWPVYDEYQDQLDHYRAERLALLSSMGENYDNMSQEDAKSIIDQRLKIERGRLSLIESTMRRLEGILNHRERAQFLQIELKIKAFVEAGIEEEIPLIQ